MESIKDYNEKNIENAITSPEVLTLPMIALRGKVILPNVYTSFDVGRIKSLAAVNAAVDSENPLVFVSAQKDAKVENPSLKDVFEIGTVCRIKNVTRMPGDNIRVNVNALFAAKIVTSEDNDKYFAVTVKEIEGDFTDTETEAYLRIVKTELTNFLSQPNVKANKEVFSNVLALDKPLEFVYAATYNMNFKEGDKQRILEIPDTKTKLYEFLNLLVQEIEIAKVEKAIAKKLKSTLKRVRGSIIFANS